MAEFSVVHDYAPTEGEVWSRRKMVSTEYVDLPLALLGFGSACAVARHTALTQGRLSSVGLKIDWVDLIVYRVWLDREGKFQESLEVPNNFSVTNTNFEDREGPEGSYSVRNLLEEASRFLAEEKGESR